MKRLTLMLSTIAIVSLSVAAHAQTVIKAGHGAQAGHPTQFGLLKFGELVAAKTGGKVKVEVYPDRQLGEEREMVEGLQLGTVDMAVGPTGRPQPSRPRSGGRGP